VGLALAWSVWTQRPWAGRGIRAAALAYVAWAALDRFVLAAPEWRFLGAAWFVGWAALGLAGVFALTAGFFRRRR